MTRPNLSLAGKLSHREAATVLAALRVFQQILDAFDTVEFSEADVRTMEHFEDGTKPLTSRQIDALCERINFGAGVELQRLIARAKRTMDGDSNDAEHDALFALVQFLEGRS